MSRKPLIVNVSNFAKVGGFFETHFQHCSSWEHFSTCDVRARSALGRSRLLVFARRLSACWRAAWYAKRQSASLVISHDPRVTYPMALFLHRLGFQGKHLAFSFNYDSIPKPAQCRIHAMGFRHVDRFVVYSNMERELYHRHLDIWLEKIDFIHWGVNPPAPVPPDNPIEQGEYICAIGGNSRDYATLLESLRLLPAIRLVLVARPHNLAGLTIPNNVTVRSNIPLEQAMNILAFSRFMVLPLAGDNIPCGHITLVHAMHLGKAFIATNSSGIQDYAFENQNCLFVPPGDFQFLSTQIQKLWNDHDLSESLGRYGKLFAMSHCVEAKTKEYLQQWLRTGPKFASESPQLD